MTFLFRFFFFFVVVGEQAGKKEKRDKGASARVSSPHPVWPPLKNEKYCDACCASE